MPEGPIAETLFPQLGPGWTCLVYARGTSCSTANRGKSFSGNTYKVYVSPDGQRLRSIVTAQQHMEGPICISCGSGDDSDGNDILLCDSKKCNNAYHLACLEPKLTAVPEGDWFCPTCTQRTECMEAARTDKSHASLCGGDWEDLPIWQWPGGIHACAANHAAAFAAATQGSRVHALEAADLRSGPGFYYTSEEVPPEAGYEVVQPRAPAAVDGVGQSGSHGDRGEHPLHRVADRGAARAEDLQQCGDRDLRQGRWQAARWHGRPRCAP